MDARRRGVRLLGALALAGAVLGAWPVHARLGPSPLPKAWPSPSPHPLSEPPNLAKISRPDVLRRVDAREVMTHADLDDYSKDKLIFPELGERVRFIERRPPKEGDRDYGKAIQSYDFYVGVRVHAPVKRVRDVLTDYRIYKKLIPYVDAMEFNPRTRVLAVEGGIWKFRIRSRIRFEERGERWLRFRIIGGHFRGLEGELLLEPLENSREAVTRVWMRGQSVSRLFPPGWVIEQGAQVVFSYTATQLRSFIESGKTVDQAVPELLAKPMGTPGPASSSVPRVPLVFNPDKSPNPFKEEEEKTHARPSPEASGVPVPRPRRSL